MLDRDHADRRQLADLVATEPPPGRRCQSVERVAAATARIRIVIDDLIHLILRLQFATGTPMPRLPTSLTPIPLAHQLLRLRASLRPPLRP